MKKLITILLLAISTLALAQENSSYETLKAEIEKIKLADPPDGNDRQVWSILEKLNEEAMQGDTGEVSAETVKELSKLMQDPHLKNRHLLALFHMYQSNITDADYRMELQTALAKLMMQESQAVYGAVPCLFMIYGCETLMANGFNDKAARHAEMGLHFYVESIPLQVYRHELTTDAAEKKTLHDKLLKDNPNHWMIKQFLKP